MPCLGLPLVGKDLKGHANLPPLLRRLLQRWQAVQRKIRASKILMLKSKGQVRVGSLLFVRWQLLESVLHRFPM